MHRRTLSVAALAAVVGCLLGPLLAVVVTGPSSASSGRSGSAGPGAAGSGAGSVLVRHTRFRVVDHNIEHRPRALESVLDRARRFKAQAITLQEICWWQARDLRESHPGWTVAWKPEQESGWCAERVGVLPILEEERRYVGNVAIWTGGRRGGTSSFTFRNQLDRTRDEGLACVTWTAGAAHRVCSLHLLSANRPRKRALIRTGQAREVHRLAAAWVGRDELVVLGGDFNAQPDKKPLDYIYDFRGRGSFREATPCTKHPDRDCRDSEVTFDGGRTKIDYIFFSANRMAATAPRHLTITPTKSDHHMLSGWAYVDATAR